MDPKPNETMDGSIRIKRLLTIAFLVGNFLYGALYYLVGPSRYDISDLTNSNFRVVSFGETIRAIGVCMGSILSGFVYLKLHRVIGYAVFFLAAGVVQLVTPFLKHISLYLTSEFFYGFTNGLIGVAITSLLLEMWQTGANVVLQATNFSYSIGMTVVPLIIAPFLSDKNSTEPYKQETHIVIPYSIVSSSVILFTCSLIVMHIKMPYSQLNRSLSKKNRGDSTNQRISPRRYSVTIVIFGMILLCNCVGVELNTFGFAATFATVIGTRFTKAEAAFMVSVMSGAFAAGRLAAILIATRLSPKYMMIGSYFLLTTGNVLLVIFSNTNRTFVWVAVSLTVRRRRLFFCVVDGVSCMNDMMPFAVEEGGAAEAAVSTRCTFLPRFFSRRQYVEKCCTVCPFPCYVFFLSEVLRRTSHLYIYEKWSRCGKRFGLQTNSKATRHS